MRPLHLYRTHTLPGATLGLLVVNSLRLFTLEPPWRNNKRSISCIPDGVYEGERYISSLPCLEKFKGRTYVLDVPDREGILFHPGNYAQDTQGCILLGEGAYLNIGGRPMVTWSARAYKAFIEEMKDESSITLVVTYL